MIKVFKMTLLTLALLFAGGLGAQEVFAPLPRVSAVYEKTPEAGISARIEAFSRSMLGVKYKLGPLGEGPDGEFDSDPLVDLARVDCMTFVEEMLALARAKDSGAMMDELRRIRYKDGVIEYTHRNHFTDLDWLPNNEAAGFIRDITKDVAGADAAIATKRISKRAWYEKKTLSTLKGPRIAKLSRAEKDALLAKLRTLGKDMPEATATIDYVPIQALAAHAAAIPSGTIVSLVRADDGDKHETLVSHMGLFVKVDGKPYFREASSDKGKVVDLPLLEYFKIYEHSTWPLLGLNLAAPLEP